MAKIHSVYALHRLVCLVIVSTAATFICLDYAYYSTSNQPCSEAYSVGTMKNDTHSILDEYIIPDRGTTILATVPKVIYMLWDKGWENAPSLQTLCLNSFRRHNPEFIIKAIDLTEAERLISRKEHYTDLAWNSAKIQAKSDIIRVELMARYGGIWADASVYCNEPILNWLNDSLLLTNFLAFERKDAKVNETNSPWIASWFLVATTNSDMMQTWRDRIRQAWAQEPNPKQLLGYFWVHRLFRILVLSNSTFGTWFHKTPFLDAALPHCWGPQGVLPHVYKLKAKSCRNVRREISD